MQKKWLYSGKMAWFPITIIWCIWTGEIDLPIALEFISDDSYSWYDLVLTDKNLSIDFYE